ncbi:uncharacterized protein TrAtP1_002310 [Trichoderma atroviride]|uniref:uncharacterized protein n=1 Tax=Hypocrea atroviridis TaxID=63577 RepID=UPI0033347A97|nr:hypothetical protein TrAtP1_002310 [Trichoderma atroviride]
MPPEGVASAVRIRKVHSFIDFAATLQSQLSGLLDAGDIELLVADTGHHIQKIHNAVAGGLLRPQPGSSEGEWRGGLLRPQPSSTSRRSHLPSPLP